MTSLEKRVTGASRPQTDGGLVQRILIGALVLLVIYTLLVVLSAYYRTVAMRSLTSPFGDDGIWSVMARMQATGHTFYVDFWNNKPPINILILSVFVSLFGHTLTAMSAGLIFTLLLLVTSVTAAAYQVSQSRTAALVAALVTLIYTGAQRGLDATITMASFGALAVALALAGRGRWLWMLAAGFVFGAGFMTKQPVGFELPAVLLFAMARTPGSFWRRARSAVGVMVGFALLMGVILLWTVVHQMTAEFWFHVFGSTWKYVGGSSGTARFSEYGLSFIRSYFIPTTLPYMAVLFMLSAVAALILFATRRRNPLFWITLLWIALSFGAASVQLALREEYFRQMLPALVALIALGTAVIARWSPARQAPFLVLLIAGTIWFGQRYAGGFSFETRPLPGADERQVVIDTIVAHTKPTDCVWEWGNLNYALFLSGRDSCTASLLESNLMDTSIYPTKPNRIEFIHNLFDHPPALFILNASWGFFPELQKFVDRYVGPEIMQNDAATVFEVDMAKMHRINAILGGEIGLVAYDLTPKDAFCPGDTLETALTWRRLTTPTRQYQSFVQIVSADETVKLTGHDDVPAVRRPTDTWVDDHEYVLGPTFTLQLPADAAPGSYKLIAGLYDVETQEHLPVLDDSGQVTGSYAHLHDITIKGDC